VKGVRRCAVRCLHQGEASGLHRRRRVPPAYGYVQANVRRRNWGVNKYCIPYFSVANPVRRVTARPCAAVTPDGCNCGTPYNHLTLAVRHLIPTAAARTQAAFHGSCVMASRCAACRETKVAGTSRFDADWHVDDGQFAVARLFEREIFLGQAIKRQ